MADDRVQQLEEVVQGLTHRVYRLEGQVYASWRVPAPPPAAPAGTPIAPAPGTPQSATRAPSGWAAGPPSRPSSAAVPRVEVTASRLLAVAGGVALLLGVGFLLRYAAAQGWLGPGVRVLLALAGSAALASFGMRIERQAATRVIGQICTATAAAGAYAAVVAASVNYGLVPAAVGLLGAAAVAGALVARGVASRSQLVAALGIVGALTAPAFVDPAPDVLGLAFLVLAILAGVAVGQYGRWPALTGVVFVFAWPQIASIASSRGPESVALWLTAIAATAFLVGGLGHARGHGWDKAIGPLLLVAANGFFVAALGWFVLADFNIVESLRVHPNAAVWLLGVATVHLGIAAVMSRRLFNPPAAIVTCIVGLLAADSALVDLTDGYVLAVILTASAVLAAVAAGVPWLRDAARTGVVIQVGLIVLHALLVVIHLAPAGSLEGLAVVAVVCAVAVGVAELLRRSAPELAVVAAAAVGSIALVRLLNTEAPPVALLSGTDHLAAAVLMCVLIAAAAWAVSGRVHRGFLLGAVVAANYALSLAAVAMDPDGIGRVALTALWAAGGGAALVAGRTYGRSDVRRGGAALLTAAVAKAALVDTATLAGTNRVAALLLCGSVLVATAVAEARAPRTGTPAT
jgi:uncharacterized membrane protein